LWRETEKRVEEVDCSNRDAWTASPLQQPGSGF
jgi:hypothetical protein